MTVGNRIKSAREAAGITQGELGGVCGVTKQTIFKYENDIITNIPLDKLKLIADHLKISAAYLMGWENASGEQDVGLTAIDIAKQLNAPKMLVHEVMEDMGWPDATDPETLNKIRAEVERRTASTPESERSGTTESSKKLNLLARHLDKIPEETRNRLVKNFEETIDTYLDAMGIPREGE